MASIEQQTEELEVLRSIFDGDHSFSVISSNVIQYRFGDDGDKRSFLLEIAWPANYPVDDAPRINLELFYNKRLSAETKRTISTCLLEEARNLVGSPMTYSLIEIVKDRFDQLTEHQQIAAETESKIENDTDKDEDSDKDADQGRTRGKSEKLTKAQKRKQWDRGQGTEKPRGWNWVDIVKHLSQTGNQ